ncbi:MAG: hypothetical protein E6772_09755 [Dysgonomonas sp.]|nr:hypothetical protein [Dysgonomonas sp.]
MQKNEAQELLNRIQINICMPLQMAEICQYEVSDDDKAIIYGFISQTTEDNRKSDYFCKSFLVTVNNKSWITNEFEDVINIILALRTINNYE